MKPGEDRKNRANHNQRLVNDTGNLLETLHRFHILYIFANVI